MTAPTEKQLKFIELISREVTQVPFTPKTKQEATQYIYAHIEAYRNWLKEEEKQALFDEYYYAGEFEQD